MRIIRSIRDARTRAVAAWDDALHLATLVSGCSLLTVAYVLNVTLATEPATNELWSYLVILGFTGTAWLLKVAFVNLVHAKKSAPKGQTPTKETAAVAGLLILMGYAWLAKQYGVVFDLGLPAIFPEDFNQSDTLSGVLLVLATGLVAWYWRWLVPTKPAAATTADEHQFADA